MNDQTPEAHVMTVRGPVDPAIIGATMMHEHVFMDGSGYHDSGRISLAGDSENGSEPIDPALVAAPFDIRIAGLARYALWGYPSNMVISSADDLELMVEELGEFKAAGGGCIVDMTSHPLKPDPAGVRLISERLGLHAVMSTGLYTHDFHPDWVEEASVARIAEFFMGELRDGVAGTDVRAGSIGEIGTSPELQPCEERVLRGAARAGAATDTSVDIHTRFPSLAAVHQMIDAAEAEGLPPERLWFSHLDEVDDHAYHVKILKRGVTLGFDSFGQDGYFTPRWKSRSDNEKSRGLADLIECGFGDQLVVGQDVCRKHLMRRFGGLGYDHVIARVLPRLQTLFKVDSAAIDALLVRNPRRLLSRNIPA